MAKLKLAKFADQIKDPVKRIKSVKPLRTKKPKKVSVSKEYQPFYIPDELTAAKEKLIREVLGGVAAWEHALNHPEDKSKLGLENIIGVSIGQKWTKKYGRLPRFCVVVYVQEKADPKDVQRQFRIPKRIQVGKRFVETDIQQAKKARAYAASVQGGDSCGLKTRKDMGTIACCCAVRVETDAGREFWPCILSNNHVFGSKVGAVQDSKVVHPHGAAASSTVIGYHLRSSQTKQVDAAVAYMTSDVSPKHKAFDINPEDRQVSVGETVQTFGAKTKKVQTGKVVDIQASDVIEYAPGEHVVLRDQIKIIHESGPQAAFSQPGDSGSLIVDINQRPVGIVVGGPSQAPFHTVATHMHHILSQLEIVKILTEADLV